MEELLKVLAQGLVDHPEQVKVSRDEPKVDGKQGRIAKAIRTIVRSTAVRKNEKVVVEIN